MMEYTPPAMPPTNGNEYFNVLKFYSLSPQVITSILSDLDYPGANAATSVHGARGLRDESRGGGGGGGQEGGPNGGHGGGAGWGGGQGEGGAVASPELPFIPDEDEDRLICAVSKAESVLLVGRSGTGKRSFTVVYTITVLTLFTPIFFTWSK